VHEGLPVTSGFRLVLVGKLLREARGRIPVPPCCDTEQTGLEAWLQRGSGAKTAPDDDTPEKLVFPRQHACSCGSR
jgi:hypothetical protein